MDHTPIMKKGIKAAWDPIIIKAMQELITKVETLETENTNLKTLIKNSSSFAALKASL